MLKQTLLNFTNKHKHMSEKKLEKSAENKAPTWDSIQGPLFFKTLDQYCRSRCITAPTPKVILRVFL